MIRAFLMFAVCVGFSDLGASGDSTATTGHRVGGVISGYQPGRAVHVALYSSQKGFASQTYEKSLRFKADSLPPDSIVYAFENVASGSYMVAAYQDTNSDRQLNKGWLGRPVEPYVLYRPYTGLFAPTFEKCRFRVESDVLDANLPFTQPGGKRE